MIRYLRYAFLIVLTAALVLVALANRGMVTLRALPPDMAGFLGLSWEASLPLFLVIFASILAGILIGFVWEWFREHKHRAQASRQRKETEALKREMSQLKPAGKDGKPDDVLALLENRKASG